MEKNKTKQLLILDACRPNHYFDEPDDPRIPHLGLCVQLQMKKNEETHVRKLDLDNYYHRLEFLEPCKTHFGLRAVKIIGKEMRPCYRVVPMGWLHSVTVAMAITEVILTNDAHLDPVKKLQQMHRRVLASATLELT